MNLTQIKDVFFTRYYLYSLLIVYFMRLILKSLVL